jgi:hypothetical protein
MLRRAEGASSVVARDATVLNALDAMDDSPNRSARQPCTWPSTSLLPR